MQDKRINLGIIGCGYWGPNLIRNFSSLSTCNLSIACDISEGRLSFIKNEFPHLKVTKNYKDILNDESIDAICIATPVNSHAGISIEALISGKHVFVEKPMASNLKEAEEMLKTSKHMGKKLAVGHVFQFAPAVRKIKQLIDEDRIGKIYHITSTRINLGPPKTEVDVIWDLGSHDFSIILYLLGEFPNKIVSSRDHYPFGFSSGDISKMTNNAHVDLNFQSGISAHVHLSWLSANKTRYMQIFGEKGTIVYDEMLALDGKVKLYGTGTDNRIGAKDSDSKNLSYKTGDIHVFELEQHEPLRMECEHFIDSILNNNDLINNSEIGLNVVRLLDKVASF